MNEFMKAYVQNKAEAEIAASSVKKLEEEIAREECTAHAAFESIFAEGSKFTNGAEFITAILYLFPDRLSMNDGYLCFRNRFVRRQDPCSPEELGENIRTFLADAYNILRNKNNLDSQCEKLANLHQSIMQFVYHRETYETAYLDRVLKEKKAELEKAREDLKMLQAKSDELMAALRSVNTLTSDSAVIHNRMKCPTIYAENIAIPLGRCDIPSEEGLFPVYAEWDLRAHGALCVSVSKDDMQSKGLNHFLSGILLHVLFCYPAIAKRLLLCDRAANGQMISFAGRLSEFLGGLFLNAHDSVVEQSESDVGASLLSVNEAISRRIVLLGRSGDADIFAYNAHNPDNIQPLIFVLLNGYPNGYSHAYETLEGALKNGKKAGVYFILVSDSDFRGEDTWTNRKLPEISPSDCMSGKFVSGMNDKGSLWLEDFAFDTDLLSPDLDLSELLRDLGGQIAESKENIPFLSVIPQEDFNSSQRRGDFSRVLSVPIGKAGSKPLFLDLDSTNDAHVMISGTTGSGKSSLLNTIILSACMLYSPQEIEINLISIIKSEFNIYSENGLPHLKTIITSDNVVGANDILDYLSDVMQKRMNKIGSKGDITMYNASVPQEEKIPRCLIIIDEYQRLIVDDKAKEKLREIARVGRSCGISLIVASQVVPIEFHSAMTLFRHRFEFKGSSIGDLIPSVAHREMELEVMSGLFFYGKGSEATLARLAYAGKDAELIGNINAVKTRYPQYKMRLTSEILPLTVGSQNEIPFLSPNTQRDYDENGVCKVRLGRKYLTGSQIEYAFSYKNNLLCICGEYLSTKEIEAAIIKDVLYLSRKETSRTLFYLDLNKNPNWARRATVVKEQRESWMLNADGRFVYYSSAQREKAFDDIEALISEREQDDTASICPVIVMITCVDQIERDSAEEYRLTDFLDKGKNSNVFFALQFNEFRRDLNDVCRKIDIIGDAVILPDPAVEGENYSSASLLSFLEQTEAANTTAKELCNTLVRSPLDPKLNLLCNNSEVACFTPYHYTDEFYKKLLEE